MLVRLEQRQDVCFAFFFKPLSISHYIWRKLTWLLTVQTWWREGHKLHLTSEGCYCTLLLFFYLESDGQRTGEEKIVNWYATSCVYRLQQIEYGCLCKVDYSVLFLFFLIISNLIFHLCVTYITFCLYPSPLHPFLLILHLFPFFFFSISARISMFIYRSVVWALKWWTIRREAKCVVVRAYSPRDTCVGTNHSLKASDC